MLLESFDAGPNWRIVLEHQPEGVYVLVYASEDAEVILLRQPNKEDERLPKSKVARAEYTRKSLMPDGLLDGMHPEDVRDLFAYLRTLK